jgi:hypothetical protein
MILIFKYYSIEIEILLSLIPQLFSSALHCCCNLCTQAILCPPQQQKVRQQRKLFFQIITVIYSPLFSFPNDYFFIPLSSRSTHLSDTIFTVCHYRGKLVTRTSVSTINENTSMGDMTGNCCGLCCVVLCAVN